MRIAHTIPISLPVARSASGPRVSVTQHDLPIEADRIVDHFVRCGVLRPENPVTRHARKIFSAPPEVLRVTCIARRFGVSQRTLRRRFQAEGIPPPTAWVALARALLAHRSILRDRPLIEAATAAGYSDQFAMSNAIHRITGLRPSRLQEVSRDELLSVWMDRQRKHGRFTGPPPPLPLTCPICGRVQAD